MKEKEKTQYNFRESYLYQIVILENALSSRARRKLYHFTINALFVCLFIVLGIFLVRYFELPHGNMELVLDRLLPKIVGLVFVLFAICISIYSLEAFFHSFYFKEKEKANILKHRKTPEDMFSFHTLRIFVSVKDNDITKGFLFSQVGRKILLRAGLDNNDVLAFLNSRNINKTYTYPQIKMGTIFTLVDLVTYIFEQDAIFANFLFKHSIKKEDIIGATQWVENSNEKEKEEKRWWLRDNLENIAGIGADWSYGQAHTLNRFAKEIIGNHRSLNTLSGKGRQYLRALKDALARRRESNVLLIGDPGGGKESVIASLARDISKGAVPLPLERKKLMALDGEFLVTQMQNKSDFEMMLIKILNDSISAGNIILVFYNFPAFILSAKSLESDVISLMDPYLDSPYLQIIATSERENYHSYLEQDLRVMQRFEGIIIEQPEESDLIEILENVAEEIEMYNNIVFTYGALKTIVSSVENYFSDPILPDKAIDFVVELPVFISHKNKQLVTKKDVLELVQQKTGIPLGEIQDRERKALLQLEEYLHKRVIGQNEAITTISNAMRRSRAGVHNEKRPIGSFLFIGPTGVGKTETAKSLADVFFGGENMLARLDMSEFSGDDALHRLIGSFEKSQVGILTKVIKERPYGVILLDEFEKSSVEVHNLFLQILDEGFYSDMKGKKVNARSSIFIMTSNAGSNYIYQLMKNEIDPNDVRDEVVSRIIKDGIFKPEFVNRFDAVVLFHPLDKEHTSKIADIMLHCLKKRLRDRSLDFEITSELIDYVARMGFDPVFGARPMNRYIQEYVEQVIANKLIRGDIKEGARFKLYPHDLKDGPVPQQKNNGSVAKSFEDNPFPHIEG